MANEFWYKMTLNPFVKPVRFYYTDRTHIKFERKLTAWETAKLNRLIKEGNK